MIIQYLQHEGYYASSTTIRDEANVKTIDSIQKRTRAKRLREAILGECRLCDVHFSTSSMRIAFCALPSHVRRVEGEWAEVESLCMKQPMKNSKLLLYVAYKQQVQQLCYSLRLLVVCCQFGVCKRVCPHSSHACVVH
jgi:hypothetical protein